MSKVISIANTKGGTGKTSTALNVSTELGKLGKTNLLIDFDPQASLSKTILGEQEATHLKGVENMLTERILDHTEYIVKTKIDNVSIIPGHSELEETGVKLLMTANYFALKDMLRTLVDLNIYDYIIIDTQPSKNILMLNAFTASDKIIIPTNPGKYPLMDIVAFEDLIISTARNTNPDLEILGILVTMVQRATVYRQLEADLRRYFEEIVFDTTISRLAKSEESAVEGIGISELAPSCKLARQYKALTAEILERLNVGG